MPADEDDLETRTRYSLTPGSKVTTLIALGLLVPAVYYLLAPTHFQAGVGNVQCGSALSGPSTAFNKNICADVAHENLYRSLAFLALAMIVAGVGVWFYGLTRQELTRPLRRADAWDADDEDDQRSSSRRDDWDDEPMAERSRERSRAEDRGGRGAALDADDDAQVDDDDATWRRPNRRAPREDRHR